jgi:beta-1,4-mannosyltransferase
MMILVSPAPGASGNPAHTRLCAELVAQGAHVRGFSWRALLATRPAVWHIHWPENVATHPVWIRAAAQTLSFVLALLTARGLGVSVVWTVHNLHAHEEPHARLSRAAAAAWSRLISGYICLTQGGREAASRRFPALTAKPGFVIPHGDYRRDGDGAHDRTSSREWLDVDSDDTVLLFAGKIREYKNVTRLIQVVRAIREPRLRLLIVGQPRTRELDREVRQASIGDDRIRLVLGHIPEREFQSYFQACDLVVLPFRDILNSGSAILALSMERPVLVPRLGAMTELQQSAGLDWVRTYDGELTDAELRAAVDWAVARAEQRRRPVFVTLGWPDIARRTLAAFSACRSERTTQ